MIAADTTSHVFRRVRHETRRRQLLVRTVTRVTPRMARIVLESPELADFVSAGFDDHVKLFWPGEGEGAPPIARDYTPRAFDPAAGRLTLDFALHEAGPATVWATAAKPGDALEIGGPRGSVLVPDDFDWHLLVGDETALPAIGRRLEELPAGCPVFTALVVENEAEMQSLDTRADWTARWVRRDRDGADDAATLAAAVEALLLPPGDGYVWIAAEARVARRLRGHVVATRQHPAEWMKAAGYWVRGEPGGSEKMG